MSASMRSHGATTPEDIAVEQARARGLTIEQTVTQLAADTDHVRAIWAAMDEAAVAGDPQVHRARRGSIAEHGTYARFQVHSSKGEKPCDPCREARRAYDRQRPARSHRARPTT